MIGATMDIPDIKTLLLELQAAGWRQEKIGERIGVGQAAISKLLTGRRKDMLHSNALKLIALHAEVCGASQGDKPSNESVELAA